MRKLVFKGIIVFLLGIGGGILGSQILWPYLVERPLFLRYRLWEIQRPIIEQREVTITEDENFQKIIPSLEKNIVLVKIKTKKGEIVRTGTILTSDGLISLLSQDIPKNFIEINVEGKDFSSLAKIFKQDKNISLLKIEKENLSPVSFASEEEVFLGEKVFFLSEYQEGGEKNFSINVGFLTKIYPTTIFTNMKGEKDNTSSPLFNLKGKFLGIIFLDKNGNVEVIPVSEIKEVLNINA